MSAFLAPLFGAGWQGFDNQGNVLAGGKLYTYQAGTTSPYATWSDFGLTIPNGNPIILNSAGRPSSEIWFDSSSYKVVLTDTNNNIIGTWDNLVGMGSGAPGPQGNTGPQGPQGFTGAQGPLGFGPSGTDGMDGDDGQPIPGPKGNTGAQGVQGLTGPYNMPGVDGVDGDDGMQIQGGVGPQGNTGAQGPMGPANGLLLDLGDIDVEAAAVSFNQVPQPLSLINTIAAPGATTTPVSTTGQYNITALAAATTIVAPVGTLPIDGQKLIIRFKDNATAWGLTWTVTSGAYRAVGVTLPTTTVLSKVLYVGCIYNAQDTFWDVVAVAEQ